MAAGNPTITMPKTGETGIDPNGLIQLLKIRYDGTGTQVEAQWQIATDGGFTAIVIDTGLRENDDIEIGDDWYDCHLGYFKLAHSTTYYVHVRTRNSAAETSAYSPLVSFVTAAKVTPAVWAEAL